MNGDAAHTQIAVDVGGTFTDCLVLTPGRGLAAYKSPTTPESPIRGYLNVVEKAAAAGGQDLRGFLGGVDVIVHGTTLATNALLTGGGTRVAMLTTDGFRDVVEARRGLKNIRTSMYDLYVPPYQPLVPRCLRRPVRGRIGPQGEELVPLDEAGARAALEGLRGQGVGALAICYLHAYVNGAHEARSAELAREVLGPGVHVVTSHEVLPICGEYERFSTTVVSAYVGPVVASYLEALERSLAELGFRGELLIVKSDGLVQSPEQCKRRAVDLIRSGPAAAPATAIYWRHAAEAKGLLSLDMGGTSFDVCLVPGDETPTTTENWVGDERVAAKMVDVMSIGAGGGSVAWLDALGLLRVGPESAGADPGPACYGRGGQKPTVTDADVVLGYIPPDYFVGGELTLDAEQARHAIRRVSEPLGRDEVGTAEAIFATVNQHMADAITEVSTKRGFDVRDFTLIAGGGAGPVHAAAIAELLGAPTVVVPRFPGVFSSCGMFTMDVGRDYVRAFVSRESRADLRRLGALYAEMERQAREELAGLEAVFASEPVLLRTLDLRYVGQFHDVEVVLDQVPATAADLEAIAARFHERHKQLYHFDARAREVELVSLRLKAMVRRPEPPLAAEPGGGSAAGVKRVRPCRFGGQWLQTPCYDGEGLAVGAELAGPAIVEERTTTVVVPPGFRCRLTPARGYVLERSR